MSPIITSIPPGSLRVPMLTLNMHASCLQDIPVHSLTLLHQGLGLSSDLLRLYAFSGSLRISRASAFSDRSGEILIKLRPLTVAKCSTATIVIFADIALTAETAGEHRIILLDSKKIDADGLIAIHAESSNSVLRTVGPVSDQLKYEVLAPRRFPLFGAKRILAHLKLEGSSKHALNVLALHFTNKGSARNTDLQNLSLLASDGRRLTGIEPSLKDSNVVLSFTPALKLESGQIRLFTLQGDVRAPRRRTIDFQIEEASDIETERSVRSSD